MMRSFTTSSRMNGFVREKFLTFSFVYLFIFIYIWSRIMIAESVATCAEVMFAIGELFKMLMVLKLQPCFA